MLKPISISLSPNTEKDDVWLAFKLIFQCWKWKKGGAVEKLEEEFKKYLGVKHAVSFNSGRSSLLAILNSSGLEKDDEVLLQAFTCNAAVNPVIWARRSQGYDGQAGLKPIYVDVDEETFNIDIEDLRRTLRQAQGKRPRVLMVQHTFGLPANMDEVLRVCQENNLILLEDCAHSLGATYKGKKVGIFGRASFFSFSRDKVISSVYGGMVVTNDDSLAQKIKESQAKLSFPSNLWILQQLLHPVLMNWLILPTYRFFGKYLLILFQWLHILSKAVHWTEKRGRKPGYFPKRLPNALAILALNQFRKLDRFNQHRRKIAEFYIRELSNTKYQIQDTRYKEGNIFLRFTIKHPDAHQIIKQAWNKNILLGDWYTTPIAPHDTKLDKVNYEMGSCPKAENLAKLSLNLPTHINISQKEAKKIVDFLKSYEKIKEFKID